MGIKRSYYLTFIAITIFYLSGTAQSWLPKNGYDYISQENSSFYDIQKKFNEYWENKSLTNEKKKDGEWKQFKRWEAFMEPRVYPSGDFFDPEILIKEYFRYNSSHPSEKSLKDRSSDSWMYMGPYGVPGNNNNNGNASIGGAAGRLNCIEFDPSDPNIIYVGAASGGLWRSADGGNTWSTNTDLLPVLGISEILINPLNTNEMYIATGDKYSYATYSAGLLKSLDGGATWNSANLNFLLTDVAIIQRALIHPVNPNMIIVATNNGIYRTSDASATWTNVQAGNFFDMEFHASNPNILYASDNSGLYRSTDAGLSWSPLSANLCNTYSRNSIAVTPADTNVIYVWCNEGEVFRSIDGGTTFNQMASPDGIIGTQGGYDRVITVSPVNANLIWVGGIQMGQSTDGGNTWAWAQNYLVHVDYHEIKYLPGSSSTFFACTDGGLYKTIDGGITWVDLSNGLDIKQYYRIGCSELNPDLVYAGAQDNGVDRLNGIVADEVFGGDGMECMMDYTNNNIVYAAIQMGYFSKSSTAGNSFEEITPLNAGDGAWVTPFVIDPVNPDVIYAGYSDLYKSVNGGYSWNTISNNTFGGTLNCLAVSSSNTDYIYASSFGNIFRTINGGANWSSINQNLPFGFITGIAINPSNSDNVWITYSGYTDNNKVFKTDNGGLTWQNISGTLPNIPVNCIVYQRGTQDNLYIGTDLGVYYKDATMNDWVNYNSGLPNVIVNDLEIQYAASKLRAATYGRGIWQSNLNNPSAFSNDVAVSAIFSPNGNYCEASISPVVRIKNFGLDTLFSATINYVIDGGVINSYSWNGNLAVSHVADIVLPSTVLLSGNHVLQAYTSNPNGIADENLINDSSTVLFSISGSGITIPLVEGFVSPVFPPAGWTSNNNGYLLSRTAEVGGFSNSNQSVKANYYTLPDTGTTTSYLITPALNFSNLIGPLQLDFNVAYCQWDMLQHDSLLVFVSTDCGVTYSPVYGKGDEMLATTSLTYFHAFTPISSEWRAESINLDAFIGNSDARVKFEFKSSFGNNLYIDDINIYPAGIVGVNQSYNNQSVIIHPNPASDQLLISGLETSILGKIDFGIYNALGEKVREGLLYSNSIEIQGIASGVYMLKVNTGKKILVKKFVKQ